MSPRIGFVHAGPERHGVHRFGRMLHTAAAELTHVLGRTPQQLLGHARPPDVTVAADLWIVQFTHHLYAADPAQAAARFGDVCAALRPSTVAVVLHDLPDSTPDDNGRATAYVEVARAADLVVVCSHHEAGRLRACGFTGAVTVIPHFVERRTGVCRPVRHQCPSVGVLGFLYPGKGHRDVLHACAAVDRVVSFVAIGGPSTGHEHLVDDIGDLGAALDVVSTITGWLDEPAIDRWLGSIDIPVAAHQDISASSSVATWMSAGRRPIVRAGPYACELQQLAPGALVVYDGDDPSALPGRLTEAIDDPTSTHHRGLPDVLSPASCAAAYIRLAGE